MDIFFCDVCASRVTSADFKRGFGLRRGPVVVCGSCVEKGLGQELLQQARRSVGVGSGPLEGESGSARDYFANVSPEDETDPVNQSLPAARANSESAPLKSMASGMSALGAAGQLADDRADDLADPSELNVSDRARTEPAEDFRLGSDEDLLTDDEQPDADLAEAVAVADSLAAEPEPDFADDEPVAGDADVMVEESVAIDEDEYDPTEDSSIVEAGPQSQIETQEVSADQLPDAQRGDSQRRQVPTTSARRRAASGSGRKSASGKSSTSKRRQSSSTRQTRKTSARRRKPTQNPAIVYGASAVTIGLLLILVIFLATRDKGGSSGEQVQGGGERITAIREEIGEVRRQVADALRSESIPELEAALAAVRRVQAKSPEIMRILEQEGFTEEEMQREYSNRLRWDEMQKDIRTINDKLTQLRAQQGR